VGRSETRVVEERPWLGPPVTRPGAYAVRWGLGQRDWFVVPADARESDLTPASKEERERVERLLGLKQLEQPELATTMESGNLPDTMDIWWLLLLCVLGFLLVETWMTRRMAKARL
jgi:hypothetical protein